MLNYLKFLFLLTILATGALAVSNKLETGQRLKPGERLKSRNGRYVLSLAANGNLVLSKRDGTVAWETNTSDPEVEYFGLEKNGNLTIRKKGGRKVWESHTVGGSGTYLIVQNDGNLVIYKETPASAVWSSSTGE